MKKFLFLFSFSLIVLSVNAQMKNPNNIVTGSKVLGKELSAEASKLPRVCTDYTDWYDTPIQRSVSLQLWQAATYGAITVTGGTSISTYEDYYHPCDDCGYLFRYKICYTPAPPPPSLNKPTPDATQSVSPKRN